MTSSFRSRLRLLPALFALALALPASAAAAPPDCVNAPVPKVLYSGQGRLESVIVGRGGRLYFTGTPTGAIGRLMKAGSPDAQPYVLAEGFDGPGGMVWDDHQLVVGRGNNVTNGTTGDANPAAELVRVNAKTGAASLFASGLGMANGVA